MTTLANFTADTLSGQAKTLSEYDGKVVLVVNTASKCGFTPQFEGLEKLWQDYGEQGFVVLGFPCNQFANQEPGDDAAIGEFCTANYGVSFPMFSKVDVNGSAAHPLYQWLQSEQGGLLGSKRIKWNFTKYLIGRDGVVIDRFGPTTKPEKIAPAIQKALGA